jgi:TolA-binding protein
MNVKSILPWILVAALAATAGAVYLKQNEHARELSRLRQENESLEQARLEAEMLQDEVQSLNDTIAGLRKDKEELLRLRSEVTTLRDERQQLSRQIQTAQAEAQRAQAQAAQTAEASAQRVAALQAEMAARQAAAGQNAGQQALNLCLNNLRTLEGAKQQWALENEKPPGAVPNEEEIKRFVARNIMPTCPLGGQYSFNALGQDPTCSIPGHALRQ